MRFSIVRSVFAKELREMLRDRRSLTVMFGLPLVLYPLLAIGHPQWWLALSGPVLMLLFLYRLSGIPWTEAQSLRSRGEDYRRYQREVSAFFPLPRKRLVEIVYRRRACSPRYVRLLRPG